VASPRASSASANLSTPSARSRAVVRPHGPAPSARCAARTAASRSAAVPSAATPSRSSVTASTTSVASVPGRAGPLAGDKEEPAVQVGARVVRIRNSPCGGFSQAVRASRRAGDSTAGRGLDQRWELTDRAGFHPCARTSARASPARARPGSRARPGQGTPGAAGKSDPPVTTDPLPQPPLALPHPRTTVRTAAELPEGVAGAPSDSRSVRLRFGTKRSARAHPRFPSSTSSALRRTRCAAASSCASSVSASGQPSTRTTPPWPSTVGSVR
jgi:hypothetical protein